MSTLKGKNIIVTGASSGIGEMIARFIAEGGGSPILVARSELKLRTLQQEISNVYSVPCNYYTVDLTNLEQWRDGLNKIINDYSRVDAIVNNAGIGIFDFIENIKWEDIERMFQLNVFALMQGIHQILPHFEQNKQGHIINIASQAGKISTPKSSIYGATKHAVIGYTNALRLEVASKGIYVTTVNLGPVRTNFFDMADPTGSYQQSVDRFMLDPAYVARKVVGGLFKPKREINLPYWMDIGSRVYQMFPNLIEKLLKHQFNRK